MTKFLLGLYALTAYCIGFASLLALMAFLLNLVPWGIDRGPPDPLLTESHPATRCGRKTIEGVTTAANGGGECPITEQH
jgi:hypothetical protein